MKFNEIDWTRFKAYGFESLITEGYTGKTRRLLVIDDKDKVHGNVVTTRIPIFTPDLYWELYDIKTSCVQDIILGIKHAIVNGFDCVSISLSSERKTSKLTKTIQDAEENGILVVCSAGNNENNLLRWPACYETTLNVGSIQNDFDFSDWASFGKNLDLVGFGKNVPYLHTGGSWFYATGTTLPVPDIACLCCLVWEKLNKKHGSEQPPSIVRATIKSMVVDFGPEGKDSRYGYGFPTADVKAFHKVYLEMNNITVSQLSERVERIKTLVNSGNWTQEAENDINKEYNVITTYKEKATTGEIIEFPVFNLRKV